MEAGSRWDRLRKNIPTLGLGNSTTHENGIPPQDSRFVWNLKRLILPILTLSLLSILAILYSFARPAYMRLLTYLMVSPFRTPFIDLEFLLTNTMCWRHGVDVYLSNPCDQLNRTMIYSPILLRFSFLAIERTWSAPIGCVIAILFCLSLALLPPTTRWRDQSVIGLAATSSLCVFAIERGNLDVIIYFSALIGSYAAGRMLPIRIAGYSMLLFAGLLKFYPLAALATLVRESISVILSSMLAAGIVLAIFVFTYRGELPRMAAHLPNGSYFADYFGAVQLQQGISFALFPILRQIVGPLPAASIATSPTIALLAAGLPMSLLVATASAMASSDVWRRAVRNLPKFQNAMLFIGATMIAACFLTGRSIGYRGILLLLVLPSLLLFDSKAAPRSIKLVTRSMVLAILLVMFRLSAIVVLAQNGLYPTRSPLASAIWIGFELLWWWIVAVLIGLIGCLIANSQSGYALTSFKRYLKSKFGHVPEARDI